MLLACKSEDTPRKLSDVTTVTHMVLCDEVVPVELASAHYNRLKELCVEAERALVSTIGFQLDVSHPYHFLLNFLRTLRGSDRLARIAWSIVNDSLFTTLCLRYPPYQIAAACIHLAARMDGAEQQHTGQWNAVLDTPDKVLEAICHELASLYLVAYPPSEGEDGHAGGDLYDPLEVE
eukprot:TRINITY_DN12246_c1_g1_i2.p1 TRINITY_DN12246_c1_g1~~TRINITY_DN12246_c1_g1_i2.p1  ORF type:complete len:178 (-),score=45.98 TRINITY_DN12246_c1_g1_i2:106-639(-)